MIKPEHPLTDEMIDQIQMSCGGPCFECYDDMRAAYDMGADRKFKQVIEWLEDCSIYDTIVYRGESVLVEELRKAMRPQKQEES